MTTIPTLTMAPQRDSPVTEEDIIGIKHSFLKLHIQYKTYLNLTNLLKFFNPTRIHALHLVMIQNLLMKNKKISNTSCNFPIYLD